MCLLKLTEEWLLYHKDIYLNNLTDDEYLQEQI